VAACHPYVRLASKRPMQKLCFALSVALISGLIRHALATPPPAEDEQPGKLLPRTADTVDPKVVQARMHFNKGNALVKIGAWDPALAEFLASFELNPQARRPKENGAKCLLELHRFDESMDLYESVLRDFPTKLEPDERQTIVSNLARLEGFVGLIAIDAPAGAQISIDGRERGTAPLERPIRVSAGTHVIRVYQRNFRPFETRAEVAGKGEIAVRATLEELTQSGALKVVEQSGAALDVVVDAVTVGTTPWEGQLTVGDHTVLLHGSDDLGTQPVSAPIRLGEITTLVLMAEPLAGLLRVDPMPGGASVAIDGVLVGHGSWKGKLRVGAHRVEVGADGFMPFSRQVFAAAASETAVRAELERDPASAVWNAQERARLFAEASVGVTYTPFYGGTANDECHPGCSKKLTVGASAIARVGYRLGSGLGFSIDIGYLRLQDKVSNRTTSTVHPTGQSDTGTANDTLRVEGLTLGGSAVWLGKGRFPIHLRLGLGAMLATVAKDHLSYSSNLMSTYGIDEILSAHTGYVYVAPDVRIGMVVGDRFELEFGVAALVAFSTSSSDVHLENEGSVTGRSVFVDVENSMLTGSTMFALIPSLAAHFDL
jgi:hypothetical protein